MIGWLTVLLLSAPPTAAERLERATLCIDAVDYVCAARELEAARTEANRLSAADRARLYRLSAEVALTERQFDAADRFLDQWLALEPDASPEPHWPDGWRQRLERARLRRPDTDAPQLTVDAPPSAPRGSTVDVRVRASDRSGVARVTLFIRRNGATESIAMGTTDGEHYMATVETGGGPDTRLEFWVEATDRAGNGPSRVGSPGAPRTLRLTEAPVMPRPITPTTPPDDDRLVDQWWFWTAIGGAVLVATAAGVTAWALTRDDGGGAAAPAPAARRGEVEVRFAWPTR